MNIDNLNKLIDLFDRLPDHKVDLGNWRSVKDNFRYCTNEELINDCDTCGCVAGYIPLLTGENVYGSYGYHLIADYLDVTYEVAESIGSFEVSRWVGAIHYTHRAIVLKRLRSLI
jgi:hypothetical protein